MSDKNRHTWEETAKYLGLTSEHPLFSKPPEALAAQGMPPGYHGSLENLLSSLKTPGEARVAASMVGSSTYARQQITREWNRLCLAELEHVAKSDARALRALFNDAPPGSEAQTQIFEALMNEAHEFLE